MNPIARALYDLVGVAILLGHAGGYVEFEAAVVSLLAIVAFKIVPDTEDE